MARMPDLEVLARELRSQIVGGGGTIMYGYRRSPWVENIARLRSRCPFGGIFRAAVFRQQGSTGTEHLAMIQGELVRKTRFSYVYIPSASRGMSFHSLRCDCGAQLMRSLEMIGEEGRACSSICTRKVAGSGSPIRSRRMHCKEAERHSRGK